MNNKCNISNDKLKSIYNEMVFIRKFEEKCTFAYQQGLIIGFCHLYTGQEAAICGIKASMSEGDNVITSYRCHTQAYLFSKDPYRVMCELFGRKDGLSKGKGGSMHIFFPEGNFWGGHGIVGAQIPIGTGIAFAEKYKGTDNICIAFMGDGAVNQGQVYESWNMASLWKLPILYVIENNKYAMGTAVERHSCNKEKLYERCKPMGIDGEEVDGMDFFSVYNAASELIKKVRSEKKPYILQVNTYRYRGHSMSDPATYRTKEEVNQWKARDAIKSFGEKLIKSGILTSEEIEEIDDKKTEEINEIFNKAVSCEFTPVEELETDVL
jgi:pyruvate dehydrogenase E1 component alpha subunit